MTVSMEGILGNIQQQAMTKHESAYRSWLDKLTTLSLAALTALVSLQNTYVPRSHRAIWLLCVVWSLLAVAVIAGLLALLGEAHTHRLYLNRILEAVQNAIAQAFHKSQTIGQPVDDNQLEETLHQMIQKVPYNRPWPYLVSAGVAAASVGLAVIALAVFAGLNLWP